MANPSKRKGTRTENDVRDQYQEGGFPEARRVTLKGSNDEGDIGGVPNMTIEVKNRKRIDLAGAVDEALAEQENTGDRWATAVVKRRQKNIREAYAVRPLWMDIALYREYLDLKDEVRRLRKLNQAAQDWVDEPASAPHRRRLRRAAIAVSLGDEASQ